MNADSIEQAEGKAALLPRPEPNPECGGDLAAVLLPPEGGRGVTLFGVGGPALELQAAALVDHHAAPAAATDATAAQADSRWTEVGYSGRGR